jgi:hypothetical protein
MAKESVSQTSEIKQGLATTQTSFQVNGNTLKIKDAVKNTWAKYSFQEVWTRLLATGFASGDMPKDWKIDRKIVQDFMNNRVRGLARTAIVELGSKPAASTPKRGVRRQASAEGSPVPGSLFANLSPGFPRPSFVMEDEPLGEVALPVDVIKWQLTPAGLQAVCSPTVGQKRSMASMEADSLEKKTRLEELKSLEANNANLKAQVEQLTANQAGLLSEAKESRCMCAKLRESLKHTMGIAATDPKPEWLKRLLPAIRMGFSAGNGPRLIQEGQSGSYQLFSEDGKALAIFKPVDEEKGAVLNPKGFDKEIEGKVEGAIREYVASVISPITPPTAVVQVIHPNLNYSKQDCKKLPVWKRGSLQLWQEAKSTVGADVSVGSIQMIALTDIILLNEDRNIGNILEGQAGLAIPIDHSNILQSQYITAGSLTTPFNILDDQVCWMNWSAVKLPLGREAADFLDNLVASAAKDTKVIEDNLGSGASALYRFTIGAVAYLAKRGLSIHEVGQLFYRTRQTYDKPSVLEALIIEGGGFDWDILEAKLRTLA